MKTVKKHFLISLLHNSALTDFIRDVVINPASFYIRSVQTFFLIFIRKKSIIKVESVHLLSILLYFQ